MVSRGEGSKYLSKSTKPLTVTGTFSLGDPEIQKGKGVSNRETFYFTSCKALNLLAAHSLILRYIQKENDLPLLYFAVGYSHLIILSPLAVFGDNETNH